MRIILLPLSFLFRIAVWVRNKLYNYDIIRRKNLSCKVISVGNVSSGGTGKTPMVEYIAGYYINKGKSVAVVLKGYKRIYDDMQVVEFGYENLQGKLNTENFGDEALMLLENLPKTESGKGLLITSDNKISGAKFADNKFKPDLVIIDDGFQLRKLLRDIDIVMVNPYEKRHLIPAGNFREPFRNVKRADIIIFNHKFSNNVNLLHKGNLSRAVDCSYELVNFVNIKNEILEKNCRKAIAFCGIGDPDSFKELFEKLNIEISEFIIFSDHHGFNKEDAENIIRTYKSKNADCILTTQKDFVRLKHPQANGTELQILTQEILTNYPLYYANIKLQILQNESLFNEKLENLFKEIR
jgi:tetraacyldisaccharide 4'-kinase